MAGANSIKINHFRGIDVSVPEDQVALYRATDALNMIPDATGQIRKRPGVQLIEKGTTQQIVGEIEGRCRILGINTYDLLGPYKVQFYENNAYTTIFTCAYQPLVVTCGEKILIFAWQYETNGLTVYPRQRGYVQEDDYGALVAVLEKGTAYIYTDNGDKYAYTGGAWSKETISADDPLLTVPLSFHGCAPSGGGEAFEVMNLLCPWTTESFVISGETRTAEDGTEEAIGAAVFYLQGEVDTEGITITNSGFNDKESLSSVFKVEVLVEKAELVNGQTVKTLQWVERPLQDGDAYNAEVNRLWLNPENNTAEDGTALGTAIDGRLGPSPKEGEDNVRITYKRAEFGASFNGLCKAQRAALYGVAGFKDRLFLGGGPLKNRIYYSELENPLYIGDLNFIELEQGAKVMELSGIADNLAAITKDGVYFVAGQVTSGGESLFATDALFTVSNRIPAPEPIAGGGVAILGGEIVYLSKEGVVAVTSKDQYSERYAEHRSATIDKKMLADGPKFLTSFGRYLLIFCKNEICWLLDENQPNTEGNKPYAAHQYEGFRMDGFKADFAYKNSADQLIISRDGALYRWMDGTISEDFQDEILEGYAPNKVLETKAISAYWETPWMSGTKFYLRKNFRRLGVLLDLLKGVNSAVRVEGKKNAEDWKILLDYDGKLCVFDYGNIDYRCFTYAGEPGYPDIKKKIRVKKATRFKLRFSNDIIGQTLILNQCGLDYVQED